MLTGQGCGVGCTLLGSPSAAGQGLASAWDGRAELQGKLELSFNGEMIRAPLLLIDAGGDKKGES